MKSPRGVWVVKLGGSLQRDAWLSRWLDVLATAGRGHVCIVPGGGAFADAVREAQSQWGFDDLAAHNMAILAMAQTGLMLCALNRALRPARDLGAVAHRLAAGDTPVWLAQDMLREQPDEWTSWEVTSDSLALWLAARLQAGRLVVVKSCPIDPTRSLPQLAEQGVLDQRFASLAAGAPMPMHVVPHTALDDFEAELMAAP